MYPSFYQYFDQEVKNISSGSLKCEIIPFYGYIKMDEVVLPYISLFLQYIGVGLKWKITHSSCFGIFRTE